MTSSGELPLEILKVLSKTDPVLSADAFPNQTFTEIKAAIDKLASRSMVTYKTIEKDEAVLEPEAEKIVANGSHEARVFEALRQAVDGLSVKELEQVIGDANVTKVGQGKAFKSKWISKTTDGKLKASTDSITDTTREQLQAIKVNKTADAKVLTDLKKRKLVKMTRIIHFKIAKGEKYAMEITREETDLTADMLASGAWKTANFKPYNFKALGADQRAGALHPLNKVKSEFRQIFFEVRLQFQRLFIHGKY